MARVRVEEIADRMVMRSATRKLLAKCSNILVEVTNSRIHGFMNFL
jgi:hypothetical protein